MNPVLEVGIENTKKAMGSVEGLVSAVRQSKQNDGVINIKDAPLFIAPLIALPDAISGVDEIPAELRDLDQFESQELEQAFGKIVNDPRYRKVFYGLLLIGDGIQEIIRDEEAS